jgi:hypothetical protein
MYREHVNERIQERANELIALMKKEVEVAESVHGQVPIDDLDYWSLLAYKCAIMLWKKRRGGIPWTSVQG